VRGDSERYFITEWLGWLLRYVFFMVEFDFKMFLLMLIEFGYGKMFGLLGGVEYGACEL
jgi:hypothetical protein